MSNLYSITDFGAREGTLCTDAIQRAFDAASATQGMVVIPRGTYISGTLHMGEASLCLERGAVLLGSPDPAHYPPTGFRHNERHDTTWLLHAEGACGIRDSQRGLCIMSCAGSGLVEDVTVSNLQVETHIRAGNWWGNGEPICIFSLYHNNPHNLQPDPLRDVPVNIRSIRIANVCCNLILA